MQKYLIPGGLAAATLVLSGCVIDAGDDGWHDNTSLAERTRLATEACGEGNVKEVDSNGFECKTPYGD